jgi:hypothetical protein
MTTVQHDQRYHAAADRNTANFGRFKPSADYSYAHFAGMELLDLKHHVGVRRNDNSYDTFLTDWLNKVKDHAVKNKIAAKLRNKPAEAPKELSLAAQGVNAPIVEALVEPVTPFKKGTKQGKAAKFIAAVISEEANPQAISPAKPVNADTARAEAMAAKATRQPRIQTRH